MSRTEPQSVLMYRHQGDEQHTKKVEKKPVRQEGNHTQSEWRTRKHIRRRGETTGHTATEHRG